MIEYLPLTPELARDLATAAEPGLTLPFGAELWAAAAAKGPGLNFAGRATFGMRQGEIIGAGGVIPDPNTLWEYFQSRIAGLSSRLPPKMDRWGREITTASGFGPLYDMISPVRVSKVVDSPIDAELQRLNANIPLPKKRTSFPPHGVGGEGQLPRLAGSVDGAAPARGA